MGKEGERDRKGWEGEEVSCHAQLKQGHRLAMASPTIIVLVIHRCNGQTNRQMGNSIGLYTPCPR